jgi:hypothetical protein
VGDAPADRLTNVLHIAQAVLEQPDAADVLAGAADGQVEDDDHHDPSHLHHLLSSPASLRLARQALFRH